TSINSFIIHNWITTVRAKLRHIDISHLVSAKATSCHEFLFYLPNGCGHDPRPKGVGVYGHVGLNFSNSQLIEGCNCGLNVQACWEKLNYFGISTKCIWHLELQAQPSLMSACGKEQKAVQIKLHRHCIPYDLQ